MKILLLGASGLLGHNVLHELVSRQLSVVAPLRKRDAIVEEMISNAAVATPLGSVVDTAFLDAAAKGCDAIINCAGATDMSLLRYDDFVPANVNLCQAIVDVAKKHGIKIIVHVSSANTIGYGSKEVPGDESLPPKEPFASSLYARSKLAGEEIMIGYARQNADSKIIVLNPGFMLGPYDAKPSSARLMLVAYRLPIMLAPCGGKSFVAVKDVAIAVVNALEMGRSGERYLLTGDEYTLHDFYKLQASVLSYRQLVVSVPRWILLIVAKCGDLLRLMGVATQLSTSNIRQITTKEYYTSSKACNELAFKPTSISDAIKAYFSWRS